MPTLKKIVVQDFRNIAFQELSFSPNVNCISGNNGECDLLPVHDQERLSRPRPL